MLMEHLPLTHGGTEPGVQQHPAGAGHRRRQGGRPPTAPDAVTLGQHDPPAEQGGHDLGAHCMTATNCSRLRSPTGASVTACWNEPRGTPVVSTVPMGTPGG